MILNLNTQVFYLIKSGWMDPAGSQHKRDNGVKNKSRIARVLLAS